MTQSNNWKLERIEHLKNLFEIYYRNLNHIEEQIARAFPTPSVSLLNQREQLKEAIVSTETELNKLGHRFESVLPAYTPPTESELKPSFWFYEGDKLINLVDLEDLNWAEPVYLGRSSNCQILVQPEYIRVSGQHALLSKKGEDFLLKDNQSRWGTYVNSIEIEPRGRTLADGDQVILGGLSSQDKSSPAKRACMFIFRMG